MHALIYATQENSPPFEPLEASKMDFFVFSSLLTQKTASPSLESHSVTQAFALNSPAAIAKQQNYALNKEMKRHHAPLVDRSNEEPPPIIVAVHGPPGVGKSSLIRSLVKHYTMRNLKEVKGPVTVVTSKTRRTTFVEVPNDLSAAVDVAKVADLVLLLVDAAYGFEMETFEFLNLLQMHGFPKILGVLTHLDLLKGSHMKKTIKTLKHRFWTEVHDGAKLFNLKGMKFGRYMKNDIRNLSRYMSLQKFRPLIWRNTHSYVLVDRVLDVTPPDELAENKKCDRSVCFYGYVRGPNLKPGAKVHIPGVGDFYMKEVTAMPDPCPRPQKKAKQQLSNEDKMIYCPMADLGIVSYDRDATFIEFSRKPIYKKIGDGEGAVDVEEGGEGEAMVRALHGNSETMEDGLESTGFQFFSGSKSMTQSEFAAANKASSDDSEDDEDESDAEDDDSVDGEGAKKNANGSDEDEDSDEDSDDDEDDDNEDDDYYKNDSDEEEEVVSSKSASKSRERRAAVFSPGGPTKAAPNAKKSAPGSKKKSKGDDSDDDDGNGELQFDDSLSEGENEDGDSVSGEEMDSDEESDADSDSNSHSSEHSDEETVSSAEEVPERRRKQRKKSNGDSDDEDERLERILAERISQRRSENEMDVDNGGSEEDDEEEEDEVGGGLRWKENLAKKALERFQTPLNLMKIVYGDAKSEITDQQRRDDRKNFLDDDAENPLFRLRTAKSLSADGDINEIESSKDNVFDREEVALDFKNNREIAAILAQRFISKSAFLAGGDDVLEDDSDAEAKRASDAAKKDAMNDAPMYGDFEDLETGAKQKAEKNDSSDEEDDDSSEENSSSADDDEARAAQIAKRKAEKKKAFDEAYDSIKRSGGTMDELHDAIDRMKGDDDSESDNENEVPEISGDNSKKGKTNGKPEKGALEHDWYTSTKAAMDKQQKMNLEAFAGEDEETRKRLEGMRSGLYVRVEIEGVPCELIEHFDARYPILIGALLPNEEAFGMVQVRTKRHRWFPKILKTHDPLIISVGWRRFQTMPVYSIESHGRNRMLKYTPEHMHCLATFYGPVTPPNTGFIAFQRMSSDQTGFRIAANGTVLELDRKFDIVKKLKLMGTPLKIKGHTAYIKGMFNTRLEVSKFTGAAIRTVSGIRGAVKKALKHPEGAFRASFEDKLLKSDLVFLRTWFPVEPKQYYNPVTSLLLAKKDSWQGMKNTGTLRYERGLNVPVKEGSLYKPVERPEKRSFAPLKVPRKLEAKLPFSATPKDAAPKKRTKEEIERSHIRIHDPQEKKRLALINDLSMLKNQAQRKEQAKMKEKMAKYKATKAAEEERKLKKQKENKKKIWRMEGKNAAKRAKTS